MYNVDSWTLTKTLEKRLDGSCKRMLRTALDIPLKRHITSKELCGDLPELSNSLKERRLRFIGMYGEKLMKLDVYCCYGNQHKERGNQTDQDTPMSTS